MEVVVAGRCYPILVAAAVTRRFLQAKVWILQIARRAKARQTAVAVVAVRFPAEDMVWWRGGPRKRKVKPEELRAPWVAVAVAVEVHSRPVAPQVYLTTVPGCEEDR